MESYKHFKNNKQINNKNKYTIQINKKGIKFNKN